MNKTTDLDLANYSDSVNQTDNENKVSISPYMLLTAWVKDGDIKSPYPKELKESKVINQTFLLYYFITNGPITIYINDHFNNYNLLYLPVIEVMKLLKTINYYTGFVQKYIPKCKKNGENKLIEILKKKFPYYKCEEINMVANIIDSDKDLQDSIYQSFGLRNVSSKKMTKKEFKKQIDNILTKQELLNDL